MTKRSATIFYIDFLRCIAVFAVVAIHVLGPLRHQFGEVTTFEWLAAMSFNSVTRWAVPIFIMVSGALLLSTSSPLICRNYLSKRVLKVVVPFLIWSLIYTVLNGFIVNDVMGSSWSLPAFLSGLESLPNKPAWYHLWFFYDFIPLYFVIPFLVFFLAKMENELVNFLLVAWAILMLMKLLKVESFLHENLILYSGYLLLGWFLFNRDNSKELKYWAISGGAMLLLNLFGSWHLAVKSGQYQEFFMGYQTLNTALISGMVFVLAQQYAPRLKGLARKIVKTIAKYSFGIYLTHPILLIPVRNIDNGIYEVFGSNWLAIPIITFVVTGLSLLFVLLLKKVPGGRRVVP